MQEIANSRSSDYSISNMDLNLYYCGKEDCKPNHSWGPSVRDHFLIHYIVSGKGIFVYEGKTYSLEKGQGFLISPYRLSYYQADINEPWHYKWVGFKGLNAQNYLERAGLSVDQPVFTYLGNTTLEKCLDEIIEVPKLQNSTDLMYKSKLYAFMSLLIEASGNDKPSVENENTSEHYVRKAMEFVYMNYSRKTSIGEMAQSVGLNRKYLSQLFKEATNITPQEFLINYRIQKSCDLMKEHALSISNISRSVGYDDPLLFSKTFKKIKGLSPRDYRKELICD